MIDSPELAAIRARADDPFDVRITPAKTDRRTLLRMLDEARETLFEAHQALLKEGMERDAALADAERERMRLAACGVAALGYFNGCADEYRSASLDDVLRLRAENERLRETAALDLEKPSGAL